MTTERKRIDLDAARRARQEEKGDPVEVAFAGEVFELPPSLPAVVLIGVARLQHGAMDGFEDLLIGLFGERSDEVARLGLDLDDIELVIEQGYDLGESPASAKSS